MNKPRRIRGNKIVKEEDYAIVVVESGKYGEIRIKIDVEDIEKISQVTWGVGYCRSIKGFYAKAIINRAKDWMRMNRFIMDCPKGLVVDHINHDTLDNRKCNLRICTVFENNQNKTNNTSGKVGVSWSKSSKKWVSYIGKGNKWIFLGNFVDFKDACNARILAENKYFNEVA